jgi:adenosylmethionine-8-amino-7-oxononanoate aminotransferase
MGALALGGHVSRRKLYEPMLMNNSSRVSFCNAYRGQRDGESDAEYVARLAQELDDEFQKQGPDHVCAFFAETVVGAVGDQRVSLYQLGADSSSRHKDASQQ